MKNQYFGDINDYRKYGILRCFTEAGWKVGICWMLTPNDDRKDGEKVQYLRAPSRWRSYDPPLFDALAAVLDPNVVREIARTGEQDVLPAAHVYSEMTPADAHARNRWFAEAIRLLAPADLWFFDPDNGLEVQSVRLGCRNSPKYLYLHEVEAAWSRGKSLLIFQHYIREDHAVFTQRLMQTLRHHANGASIYPISTDHVVFLFAAQPHDDLKAQRALALVQSRWKDQVRVAADVAQASDLADQHGRDQQSYLPLT
jgi:hypothetical protein